MREVEIVEARLALAAAAAEGHGAALGDAPRPREHFNLSLVLVVRGFALDVADFCKNVRCHDALLSFAELLLEIPRNQLAFADGSFDTSRSETVSPSS